MIFIEHGVVVAFSNTQIMANTPRVLFGGSCGDFVDSLCMETLNHNSANPARVCLFILL